MLDAVDWSFADFQKEHSERAAALERSTSGDDLIESLRRALDGALGQNNLRLGLEHFDANEKDVRAVVQFPVSPTLFDWFFNGRAGYRAHFVADPRCGLDFNNRAVAQLLDVLKSGLPEVINGRRIGKHFSDCGPVPIRKDLLSSSLVEFYSKIWMCTKRIGPDGEIEQLGSGGVQEPDILVQGRVKFRAIYQNEESSWLNIKGGFLSENGVHQSKDPKRRAICLERTGNA